MSQLTRPLLSSRQAAGEQQQMLRQQSSGGDEWCFQGLFLHKDPRLGPE